MAQVVPREHERLELAHHELCTALTSLRSNAELIRMELRGADDVPPAQRVRVIAHLREVEEAVDRLAQLAREMRSWRADRSAALLASSPERAGERATEGLWKFDRTYEGLS